MKKITIRRRYKSKRLLKRCVPLRTHRTNVRLTTIERVGYRRKKRAYLKTFLNSVMSFLINAGNNKRGFSTMSSFLLLLKYQSSYSRRRSRRRSHIRKFLNLLYKFTPRVGLTFFGRRNNVPSFAASPIKKNGGVRKNFIKHYLTTATQDIIYNDTSKQLFATAFDLLKKRGLLIEERNDMYFETTRNKWMSKKLAKIKVKNTKGVVKKNKLFYL